MNAQTDTELRRFQDKLVRRMLKRGYPETADALPPITSYQGNIPGITIAELRDRLHPERRAEIEYLANSR